MLKNEDGILSVIATQTLGPSDINDLSQDPISSDYPRIKLRMDSSISGIVQEDLCQCRSARNDICIMA